MNRFASSFEDSKGNLLAYRYWEESSRAYQKVAVILPGAGYHSGMYTELANAFVGTGYKVYALDFAGFGNSRGERGSGTVAAMTDSLEAFRRRIELTEGAREIVLVGHSLGALVALAYLKRYPDRNLRVVAAAPPFFGFPASIDHETLSDDPSLGERLTADELYVPTMEASLVSDADNAARQLLADGAWANGRKALFVVGESDPIVPFNELEKAMKGLPFKTQATLSFPRLGHDCFSDRRNGQVFSGVLGWLAETQFEYKR